MAHPDSSGSSRPSAIYVPQTKIEAVAAQIEEVKGVMHNNIEMTIKRGEDIEHLQDTTQILLDNSQTFRKNATALKRQQCWKNMKMTLIIAIVVLVIIAIIALAIWASLRDK